MYQPIISIITVVYNSVLTLEATIKSVLSQDSNLFEYWIIDGTSTDGSVDIIRKYESQLTGWVTERDKGIFDAMNKGVERSKGDWLYFLGADDQLEPGILSKIVPYLTTNFAVVYGPIRFNNGKRLNSRFSRRTIFQNTVHHQGAFYHRNLFESFRYDTQLRIISDYELNLQIFLKKLPTYLLPFTVALCHADGASSNQSLSLKETNLIRSRYINSYLGWFLTELLKFYYWQKNL